MHERLRPAVAACALFAAGGAHSEQMFRGGFEGPAPCVDMAADAGATLDVASIAITPDFRLNGKAFPVDNTRYAQIFLADADGYQALLGSTRTSPAVPVHIVPGLYDVIYEYVTGTGIPLNHGARLARNLWLDSDRTLRVDVTSVTVNADFEHNGVAFTNNPLNAGNLFLDGIYYGGETPLGSTSQQSADLVLLPGAYRLVYRHATGNAVPANTNARLDRHDLDASGAHVFNVASALVNVSFSLNGGAFPNSAYERGDFTLVSTDGDVVPLHDSLVTTVQRRVIPATYNVHYERIAGTAIVPINSDAIVAGPFVISGAASIGADVASVEVSGDYSVNGDPPPASTYENGETFVIDPNTGAKTTFGQTQDQSYQTHLVAQPYAVGYRIVAGGSILPSNADTVLFTGWNPVATPTHDIDIAVGAYAADLTLNGGAFPATAYERGYLYARLPAGGPATVLGTTDDGVIDRNLLPGSYFVTYTINAGGTVPRNLNAPIPGTRVVAAGSNPIDMIAVVSVDLDRDLTLDGAAFPAATNAHLRWRARHPFGDDTAFWGNTSSGAASVPIIPGEYELIYEHEDGATIPQNNHQRIACWNILPAVQ